MDSLFNGIFHQTVQTHIVGHCKNDRLLVQFRGNADIEAPLIGTFRFGVVFLAQCQIIIHCTVEIIYQLCSGAALVRDQSPDPHDLAIKQAIFLRELHTANIALVLHRVIHRSPSCSRI